MDYTQFIRTQVASYLAAYPQETSGLSQLLNQLAQPGNIFDRKNMAGHMTGSAIVMNAEGTAALFIKHKIYKMWLQPGGHCDEPTNPWFTAKREVGEETGVTGIVLHPWHNANPHPLDINTHPIPARPEKSEGPHMHHDFLHLAIAPAGAQIAPNVIETDGAAWIPLKTITTDLEGSRLKYLLPKFLKALEVG